MDSSGHDHCENCFRMQCDNPSCGVTPCGNGCGLRMHFCKVSEHSQICQKGRVPCLNAEYGCSAIMPRESVKTHLKICPASLVFCTMEWRRYPIYSKYRLNWVPFFQPNPVLVKGDLDVELALRDQRVLEEISRQRMRKGKAKVEIERRRLNDVAFSAKQRDKGLPDIKEKSEVITNVLARSQKMNSLIGSKTAMEGYKARKLASNTKSDGEGDKHGKGLSRSDCDIENTATETRETETVSLKVKFNSLTLKTVEEKLRDCHSEDTLSADQCEDCERSPAVPTPPKCVPMYLDRPLGLNVMIESLPKFMKQSPMYSVPCNQVFRRDEYNDHFRNVHNDIHGGLNGWLQHRCPLAQYGCTFVSYRFRPHGQSEGLLFSQELGSFGVKPCTEVTGVTKAQLNFNKENHQEITSEGISCSETSDLLTTFLPVEILMNIIGRLDGFSLCNLSCTCKRLREVCRDVVRKHGMVILDWEKRVYENGKRDWRVQKKKWCFSTSFAPVDQWVHTDNSFMAAHVEKCPYFDRHIPPKVINYSKLSSMNGCHLQKYGSFPPLIPDDCQ